MLEGKYAVITGGSRGIGRAMAIEFARLGANVAILYSSNREAAEKTLDEMKVYGVYAYAFPCNVASFEETKNVVEEILKVFPTVDILVNNAGIIQTVPVTEIDGKDWDRVMEVNLKGVFLCCKAALAPMKAQHGGKIINIASVAGKRGGGLLGNSCYSASKGGVIAFTKSLARESGPFGINVNAITPAFTDTEMTRSIAPDKKEFIIKMLPLGRVGQPADIAGAVCFLASSMSDYMTGEIMDVDGGLMCD